MAAPAAVGSDPGAGFLDEIMRPAMLALLIASALLDYALLAYITWWYPALPAQVPLGPDPALVPVGAVYRLPQIGALALIMNVLLGRAAAPAPSHPHCRAPRRRPGCAGLPVGRVPRTPALTGQGQQNARRLSVAGRFVCRNRYSAATALAMRSSAFSMLAAELA